MIVGVCYIHYLLAYMYILYRTYKVVNLLILYMGRKIGPVLPVVS